MEHHRTRRLIHPSHSRPRIPPPMISKLDQYIQLRTILFSKERLKVSVDEIASRCRLSRGIVLYAERELGFPPRATQGKRGRPKHPNDKIKHAKQVVLLRAQGLTQAAVG